MGTALLTGFEPFSGMTRNPSFEIVESLRLQPFEGHGVFGICLPVEFGKARALLEAEISRLQPDVVIALGLAARRKAISLERVAVNLVDAPVPDNAGRQPIDCAVVPGGPAAYFSTLPVRVILASLRLAQIPAEMSMTAGTYVCNELFYGLMHTAQNESTSVRSAGFIHVPALPGMFAQERGMALLQQIEAIRIAVQVALTGYDQPVDPLFSEGYDS